MNKTISMQAFVNAFTQDLFGTTLEDVQEAGPCVTCGGPAVDFIDSFSVREYNIPDMCQSCQDNTFREVEDVIDKEFDE